jgi:hypothetical protein
MWKGDWLQGEHDAISWSELNDELLEVAAETDDASEAARSGPIQFDLEASRGRAMLLPHLATLKRLELTLSCRLVAELHDGHTDAAWTNTLALTRLSTAWQVEPAEVSQMVRFALVDIGFDALWQALHGTEWPEEKLAGLQQEWERANFFTNLPEVAAFKRASDVAICQQERLDPVAGGPSFSVPAKMIVQSPGLAVAAVKQWWNRARYRTYGTYVDEKNLLLFYQQRELELRHAIAAPTWAQMQALPGVTNAPRFTSPYRSRFQTMLNLQTMRMSATGEGSDLLARAATAETQRRIIVTALALERFRQRHGAYPGTLTELAPDYLESPPVDFMNGQPLHYQLNSAGNFMLYSVGLDGVDDGGRPVAPRQRLPWAPPGLAAPASGGDIVWPYPASAEAVHSFQEQERQAKLRQQRGQEELQAEQEWSQSALRQSRTDKILATPWAPDAGKMTFYGQPLNDYVCNEARTGTNHPTLGELMAPRTILTGDEPEDITFEVPMNYDVMTNACQLELLVDADPDEPTGDAGGRQQEFSRATNGDCLVIWHTIYDPPGRHAVQFLLSARTEKGGFFAAKGPAMAITTSNLCQFGLDSATYEVDTGARFHGRLAEAKGTYSIECVTTNGAHLATLSGTATNGEFNTVWNLVDDHGHRLTGETFSSIVHITLPDSGRTQTLRGP